MDSPEMLGRHIPILQLGSNDRAMTARLVSNLQGSNSPLNSCRAPSSERLGTSEPTTSYAGYAAMS